MGTSGSKSRGLWPFASSAGGSGSEAPNAAGTDQALTRAQGCRSAPPFVFTRRGSMYFDEDGDLAHEFYEETIVTKNGRKRAKLKRIHKNLVPQGIVQLDHPRIHVDFPVIICEVKWTRQGVGAQPEAGSLSTAPLDPEGGAKM
uniref:Tumor suppressor 2, mitochondrial calcium regulator n=1 Tax=Ornithorhynchus anatinus TaxID=9258 RepID=A0A6I8PP39_ORNAN